MKKVFILLVLITAAITTNSCSNDRDDTSYEPSATGTVTFKLNGVQKTMNIIDVVDYKNLAGTADEYTQISVYAKSKTVDEAVAFSFRKGNLGNIISDFTYVLGGDVGYQQSAGFIGTVTSNGYDKKLVGTFSGDLDEFSEYTISEGLFDIQY